ncbi:hypothetical protein Dimus_035998 [Dionaea muscipula]
MQWCFLVLICIYISLRMRLFLIMGITNISYQARQESRTFWRLLELPQANPMDSADLLREKGAIILQSFFKEFPRDQFTWLDIVQKLGQRVSSGEIVTRDDLSLVLEQLQNPGSELYLRAFELLMLS